METSEQTYTTQEWVKEQGYVTDSYVSQAIEELYQRIVNEALVQVTKLSQLENDCGFLTAENFDAIEDEFILSLF